MQIARVKAPDGRTMRLNVPEDATQDQILAFAQQTYASQQTQPEMSTGQAALEAGTRGATLGGTDYILPLLGGLYAKAFGGDATRDIPLEELVTQGGQQLTQRRGQFREESPITAYGLEAAGSLPLGAGITGAATRGAQALGRGALPVGLAVGGAAEGAGLAEEGQKAESALFGAVASPVAAKVFSTASPAIIKSVRKFAEFTTAPVQTTLARVFEANPIAARQFMEEGVPVSALTISNNPVIQRMGSILKGTFGSTKVIENNIEDTLGALERRIAKRAFSTGDIVTPQQAGQRIQAGIGNYIDKFQATSSKLYARVGRYIGDDTASELGNLQRAIGSELAAASNAPNLKARTESNRAVRIALDAIQDMGIDTSSRDFVTGASRGKIGLNYKDMRRYRTEIGSLIKQNVISGEDNALAKRVYGALTEDMKDVARSKGTQALRAFNNANSFYQQGLEQIEQRLQRYIGTNADPGQLLTMLQSSSRNSDFKLNAIMRALPKEDVPVIRDAILQRMGQNNKGVFSPAKFVSDYHKMSNEAKKALFGGGDSGFRQSLDRLSSISNHLVQSGRYENFSRTADNLGNIGLIALGAVNPTTAAATAGGSHFAARLLTSESFAKTLAKHAKKPVTKNAMTRLLKDLEDLAVNNLSMENDITTYIGLLGATSQRLMEEE